MSLLHVQRSPSPFTLDDTTNSVDSEELSPSVSPRSRSFSESFFAVRGAAVILAHSDAGSPTSSRGCEMEGDLQLMMKQLRPMDKLKLAARLQTQVAEHVPYLAVVEVAGVSPSHPCTLLLGIDSWLNEGSSGYGFRIGVVVEVTRDSVVSLVGDGGVRLCAGGSFGQPDLSLLFRPLSVQTMWMGGNGEASAPLDYYSRRLASPDMLCLLWQQSPCEWEWAGELRADGLRGKDGHESEQEHQLRGELRQVMQSVDLEAVTTRDIKERLAARTNIHIDMYKELVDREMLVILGQLDKPSQIFPYLYLGTEWNASNWDELQSNNVGYILNMTREVDNFFPHRFVYKKIWVTDEAGTHLLSHWNQTYRFIKAAKESGSCVLVHCKKGISRSSSTVIAYAMKEYEWTLPQALQYVKKRREIITPNAGFMEQLNMFAGALEASRNREMFSGGRDGEEGASECVSPSDRPALPLPDGDAVRGIVRAFERGDMKESPPIPSPHFPLDIVSKRSSIQQFS